MRKIIYDERISWKNWEIFFFSKLKRTLGIYVYIDEATVEQIFT